MNKLFALAWLVVIGTNVAQYYSENVPYQGVVAVAGGGWFLLVFHRQFLRMIFLPDYFLALAMLAFPILLMLFSEQSFERNVYTSQISVVLIFIVASLLASSIELDRTRMFAAFTIVAIGVTLNLYELFVQNNVWSISPGRSTGLYVNPNYSSGALLGFALVFLTARFGKFGIADLIVMALVITGVFATFSRTGILASFLLLTAVALMRVEGKYIARLVAGGAVVSLAAFVFASYVVQNLDLSEDASVRVFSLLEEGGVGDYEEDRGDAIFQALDLIAENPVSGGGVGTIYSMAPQGPHNMFLAMMVDYGIGGLIVYVAVIVRLMLIARHADRSLSAPIWLFVAWLVIFSLASHSLLDNSATIPLLGFALARAMQIQFLRRATRLNR